MGSKDRVVKRLQQAIELAEKARTDKGLNVSEEALVNAVVWAAEAAIREIRDGTSR